MESGLVWLPLFAFEFCTHSSLHMFVSYLLLRNSLCLLLLIMKSRCHTVVGGDLHERSRRSLHFTLLSLHMQIRSLPPFPTPSDQEVLVPFWEKSVGAPSPTLVICKVNVTALGRSRYCHFTCLMKLMSRAMCSHHLSHEWLLRLQHAKPT